MLSYEQRLDVEATSDLGEYERVRFQAAREAGLTRLEAARFAFGSTPLRTLRRLQAGGCPAAVIARIVC